MFSNLGSMTNFENFHFFSTPSEGGWGKKDAIIISVRGEIVLRSSWILLIDVHAMVLEMFFEIHLLLLLS